MFAELDRWHQIVEENEAAIRSALSVPAPGELWIRMKFEEGGCWFYEAVCNVRIALHTQKRASDEATRTKLLHRP